MKRKFAWFALILFTCTQISCNTYRWQRKRYYQADKTKNWNYFKQKEDKKKVGE